MGEGERRGRGDEGDGFSLSKMVPFCGKIRGRPISASPSFPYLKLIGFVKLRNYLLLFVALDLFLTLEKQEKKVRVFFCVY